MMENKMPFRSQAQRRFLFATDPKLAQEFADKTPKGAKLPEKVKPKPEAKPEPKQKPKGK